MMGNSPARCAADHSIGMRVTREIGAVGALLDDLPHRDRNLRADIDWTDVHVQRCGDVSRARDRSVRGRAQHARRILHERVTYRRIWVVDVVIASNFAVHGPDLAIAIVER